MKFNIYQVKLLTLAQLKVRYRSAIWGFAWVILNPTLQYCAQAFAFHFILRLNVENYPLFLLSGVLPWVYFVQTLEMGTSLIVNQGRLLKSFPAHPFVLLSSLCLENFVGYCAASFLLTALVGYYYEISFINLLLLPLPMFSLVLTCAGLAFGCALINAKFRDMRFIVSFGLNILFYVTPIFYPEELIPENFSFLIHWNPVVYLIKPFRAIVNNPYNIEFVFSLGQSFLVAIGALVFAGLVWMRRRNYVYFEI
jgi:lipopolysaccharide transport system permease protein